MAKKSNENTYWPHMIMGFLLVGITLGYWTVKSAVSIPVQKSNEYMLKYQQADMNINDILKKKMLFDKKYDIQITNAHTAMHEIKNSKVAKQEESIVLSKGENSFFYVVKDKSSVPVSDANVSFLLTRPHTKTDDVMIGAIPFSDGKYRVNVSIEKPGRYILRLRVQKEEAVGYLDTPAYLKP